MAAPALIAVDWGTSSWRGALLDASGRVIEERAAQRGILGVAPGAFETTWRELCAGWLDDPALPCLISGMAGSRQGWVEAPYAPCPAGFAELAASVIWIDVPEGRRLGMAPGLSAMHDGLPDVMRGEEVQIFGAARLLGLSEGLFVLPGTHSKWARLADSQVTGFHTRMTGELYALLRGQSILSRLMPSAQTDEFDEAAFRRGVRTAQDGDVLSLLFSARTLGLFSQMAAQALPSYLSGLLIGEEFRAAQHQQATGPIVLVGSDALVRSYACAATELALPVATPPAHATWAGLSMLARAAL